MLSWEVQVGWTIASLIVVLLLLLKRYVHREKNEKPACNDFRDHDD